jgi:membrane-associated protease RseP (regulator of RpoE activity)
LLLAATFITTTLWGTVHYVAFRADFREPPKLAYTTTLLGGLSYSLTLLAILGCHELGHYLACRYYDVDASLPFFLPFPFTFSGTLGAFIRIREPIPTKRMLFDIGIAGPIAGFLVAVPLLVLGVSLSNIVALPPRFVGTEFGEPLIFQWIVRIVGGPRPPGYDLNMHPVVFAGWFGLLATFLNLFPIGQLDGGHISYAILGRKSFYVTMLMVGGGVMLSYFFTTTWVFWTVLMVAMLLAFGPHHPRTTDEHVPLDRARKILALFALLMFVLCFMPVPFGPAKLIVR